MLETLGWLLVVTGIAALVLPGPGLLMMFAGLAIHAQHYAWAQRWLEPVRRRALEGAAESVKTWPRILLAILLALGVIGCGVIWIWSPPPPSWWPVRAAWWLPGGAAVAVTQIASGLVALALIAYSCARFRADVSGCGHPSAGESCLEGCAA